MKRAAATLLVAVAACGGADDGDAIDAREASTAARCAPDAIDEAPFDDDAAIDDDGEGRDVGWQRDDDTVDGCPIDDGRVADDDGR